MHYILLHGTGGHPEIFWFSWLRKTLEKQGHTVSAPQLPKHKRPERQLSRDAILENYTLDNETVLIGHSSGATLILSILDALSSPIAKAILVAGYYAPLPGIERSKLMLQSSYDRDKMADNANDIYMINSDNDPYHCHADQARPSAERLGATFVFAEGKGHMGTEKYDDPCEELPFLLDYL